MPPFATVTRPNNTLAFTPAPGQDGHLHGRAACGGCGGAVPGGAPGAWVGGREEEKGSQRRRILYAGVVGRKDQPHGRL